MAWVKPKMDVNSWMMIASNLISPEYVLQDWISFTMDPLLVPWWFVCVSVQSSLCKWQYFNFYLVYDPSCWNRVHLVFKGDMITPVDCSLIIEPDCENPQRAHCHGWNVDYRKVSAWEESGAKNTFRLTLMSNGSNCLYIVVACFHSYRWLSKMDLEDQTMYLSWIHLDDLIKLFLTDYFHLVCFRVGRWRPWEQWPTAWTPHLLPNR